MEINVSKQLGDWLNGPAQIKLNVKIEYIIVKENRVKNEEEEKEVVF